MLDPTTITYIKNHAQRVLDGIDENLLEVHWDLLNIIFQLWKSEHGDRQAKYKRRVRGLSDLTDENKIKSFEDAAPWDCAGLEFPSRLGLALKLKAENYPDFMKAIEKPNYLVVLALLIVRQNEPCSDSDLFNAHEVLTIMLRISDTEKTLDGFLLALPTFQKHTRAGKKQLQNLAKGNPAAAKNKHDRAEEYHQTWKIWAREYWEKAPAYRNANDALDHVCSLINQNGHTMANRKPYARKTIQKIIAGVKKTLKAEN